MKIKDLWCKKSNVRFRMKSFSMNFFSLSTPPQKFNNYSFLHHEFHEIMNRYVLRTNEFMLVLL